MRLGGWIRLWVLLTVLWTLFIGWLTWSTWPPSYPSLDPNASVEDLNRLASDRTVVATEATPPQGSPTFDPTKSFTVIWDSTLDEIMREDEKLTRAEFIARIRVRYPVYNDLSDDDLLGRMLDKYPFLRSSMTDIDPLMTIDAADRRALNRANRNRAVLAALALWLVPPVGLYAFGFGVGWVYRGFRHSQRRESLPR
jgi:hypothetical protein